MNFVKTKLSAIAFFFLFFSFSSISSVPFIGAQVFIEAGQTDEEIDTWFRIMNEKGMKVCRIRMFEDYMQQNGEWDFSLFDKAFLAAEKYDVKILATLFPSAPGNSLGGFKFPLSEAHEDRIASYIEKTVNHFKNFNALWGWVLMNEPGVGESIPDTDYYKEKFEKWKLSKKESLYKSKGYNIQLGNFDNEKFLVDYNTQYLKWIADEIARYDTKSHIHVNNHQIFDNAAEYDFPAWRKFISSLGASAHASWHFKYFKREQYPVAMLANCSMIRSGAGHLPFLVTELQGGNNTYSGGQAICPTKEDITQWLWSSICSGAQGIIFWSLNPRSIGEEAGEWALIDFQNNSTDRLESATNVIKCLNENQSLFESIKPFQANVNLIYTRESLWTERRIQYGDKLNTDYEGRQKGGVIKSTLAYYEMLLENGINTSLSEINEFDWNKKSYKGQVIILANQIAISSCHWKNIRNFVEKGGKLIVEGLTAFYDENMLCLYNTGFPFETIFGGNMKETKCSPGDFSMNFKNKDVPVHLWKGYISNRTGKIISQETDFITGISNEFGKGEVIWLPSLLGLGSRRTGDYSSLSDLLLSEITQFSSFRLKKYEKGIIMQTFTSNVLSFSLVINKNSTAKTVSIEGIGQSTLLFADKGGKLRKNTLRIMPNETIVIKWE